ncbi:MAG: SpoIIE family protein phosphatase [Bacteroidales bacterium]|nr:SpoIIE family protein phosphatase [Bacteroidales bacterium]
MYFKSVCKISLILTVILSVNNLYSQNFNKYKGLPFIRNYTTEEYNAHEQNFDIIQDTAGIMYFANFAGILKFDGTKWSKTVTSSGMRVLSLDIDKNGRVYAGGLSDFGYIEQTVTGKTKYISLTDSLNEDVGMIFKVLCGKEATWFISEKSIYTYDGTKISKQNFENKALSALLVSKESDSDNIYIFFEKDFKNQNLTQNGLTLYKNKKFIRIKDKSNSQLVDVQTIFNNPNNESLILGTSKQGLFLLKNNVITDFDVDINNFIKAHGHTCGDQITETTFALGTFTGGIIISDNKGKTLQIIDKNSLLQDESVNALFIDRNNSLWIATNNGISKVEINWNLSYIDNINTGLEGKVQDIKEYKGNMYFATDNGLFYLEGSFIKKVKDLDFACWDIEVINNTMITATTKGIFIISSNSAIPTDQTDFSFCITLSLSNPNVFYSGHNGSINIYNLNNNKIIKNRSIKTAEGDVFKIYENTDNDIFAEISPGRIFRYSANNEDGEEMKAETKLISLHLNKIKEDIFFSSEKGLYYYNKETKKVEDYNLFANDASSHSLWIHELYELDNNTLIITDGEQKNISLYQIDKNAYKINQTPLLPIANFSVQKIFYSPTTSVIWIGGRNGLVLYNHKNSFEYESKFKTLIRSVIILGKDSLLDIYEDDYLSLNFSENSLRFEFSAPVFISKGKILYRYILEGFDKDTSNWTELTGRDYTNIPDGKYTFSVKAKNEFGKLLNKSQFKFQVLKPMYRKWWAFIIYFSALFAIVRIYMNWRMKAVEKEREILENTVKERTEEIAQSKEEIETQRDGLYKQKKEIVDSINYAQRIQKAVLPSPELMNEVLKDHFVFFIPRDIVSGDFYWIKKIRKLSFVVAADCTGHGVPGAFMSMLGSSFLNEIVTSRTLDNAAFVLNRLRNKVKKSLHQKGEEGEQKDGMDISILIIDWETLELQFAGAYNSLYIIRKNEGVETANDEENYEIIRLKADRQPIGIYIHEKDFTNHTFQLKKGDTLYAMSDGFVDQFGGDTGGKFKSIRFKKLLLSFQDKTMEEQNHILGRTFNKWKRDIDQVDDVLVIGMRI